MEVEITEIDRCIVCFQVEPVSENGEYLSHRLASRLDVSTTPEPLETIDPVVYPDSSTGAELCKSSRGENGLEMDAPSLVQQPDPIVCILPQLRRLFVLLHVFEHRLDHPETDKMMLLLQCPSDWFVICSACCSSVDLGIYCIEELQKNADASNGIAFRETLKNKIMELQQKFVDSYLEYTPACCWEFPTEDQTNGLVDIPSMNFLLTETEAVAEFRQFIHITAFYRLSQRYDPTPNGVENWSPYYNNFELSFNENMIPVEYGELSDEQNVYVNVDSEPESASNSGMEDTFPCSDDIEDASEDNPWYYYCHTLYQPPANTENWGESTPSPSVEENDSSDKASSHTSDLISSSDEDVVTSTVAF